MNTCPVRRPARSTFSDARAEPISLAAPPQLGEAAPMSGSLGMILVPAASGVGAVLLAVTQQDRPLMAAAGLLVLTASIAVGLAMVVGSRTGARRRTREQRERYLDYLEQARSTARDGASAQRTTADLLHPSPSAAAGLAWQPARRWERRPGDADFLLLRAGLGVVPLNRRVTLLADPNDPLVTYDPVCLAAAEDLAATYDGLADQPICVPLDQGVLTVIGAANRVRGVARALLAQLAWAHSPDEVAILVCSSDRSGAWDWLKWLPHSLSSQQWDGPLPARLFTPSAAPALEQFTAEISDLGGRVGAGKRIVLVIDLLADPAPPAAEVKALSTAVKAVGACQVHLLRSRRDEPAQVDIRLLAGDAADAPPNQHHQAAASTGDHRRVQALGVGDPGSRDPFCPANFGVDLVEFGSTRRAWCRFDDLDMTGALLLAKSFAPLRAGDVGDRRPDSRESALDPLRFGDIASIDPDARWQRRPPGDLLRVAIGSAIDGTALVLDLKESAQGGIGPHGLVVGATGSGKSELLRTLVTALVLAHPPETLALLLADFKGGATFSGLARLPHVAGMITNLEADLTLVDRFRDALAGEVQRRQELLAAAGKLTSVQAYVELRSQRADLEAMPHLLVIVDEFSELLGARPDLADLFVTIGRIGRSIGIHLLLATQRLDTGRIRGLESHLSYRICLRTFAESESREAIGSPYAYHLPAEPGWGYLRADSPDQRLFRATTVSRPYRPPQSRPVPAGRPILPYNAGNGTAARIAALHHSQVRARPIGLPTDTALPAGPVAESRGRTVLDVVVGRLTELAPHSRFDQRARPVWLDPLPRRLLLAELLSGGVSRPEQGTSSQPAQRATDDGTGQPPRELATDSTQGAHVAALLGLVDIPQRQRQQPLVWDFTTGNGNLLIVGSGQSGKSVVARTLLVSLALRYSPAAVQVICVDFGGETLVPFAELPHVAAVATRSDPELTRRVFARILGLLTEREALFRQNRFESTAALRRALAIGMVDSRVAGDVVLILDGWSGISDADGVPAGVLDEILRRGTGVGVHTVLTVGSPSHLRSRLLGGFGGRIELRLSDSFDSAIDRQLAKSLPPDIPGRALVAGRHYAQIALPSLGAGGPARPSTAAGSSTEVPPHSTETVIAAVRTIWPGQSVSKIKTLPELVSLTDLQACGQERPSPGMIIGLAEDNLRPLRHHLAGEHAHLVVYGDGRSGKTTVLRTLLAQLVGTVSAAGSADPQGTVAQGPDVIIVDYRRGLSVPGASINHRPYGATGTSTPARIVATDPVHATAVCGSLATRLACRINDPADTPKSAAAAGHGATADQRAHRPEIYLLVDDYDLVGARDANPLQPLLPFLAHGADIGFHLVLTRRTGGAARAQYETLLQCLGDLGTPVVMLSGSPTEGRLAHGMVPQLLPPGRARLARSGSDPQMLQTAWVAQDPAG